LSVPNLPGKDAFGSVYTAADFVRGLRNDGWDPGAIPRGVIFTYGGFDLLCGAELDHYSMNPMLGPGPGRFFTANSTDGSVGVCCMGIGAPAVAAQLEVLICLGMREFLSIGTAGGLQPDQSIGDVVVLNGAVRDEGVSYHYLAPAATVEPDDSLTAALLERLLSARMSASEGITWTTDAPYRETAEEVAHYREAGVLTVEMEAAALFAVAEARRVALASAVVLDAVIGEPIGTPTMDTAAAFGRLYDVFLAGIEVLAQRTSG
jgi:purine-nucleoside phosphorylase